MVGKIYREKSSTCLSHLYPRIGVDEELMELGCDGATAMSQLKIVVDLHVVSHSDFDGFRPHLDGHPRVQGEHGILESFQTGMVGRARSD
jgi:hypothetical protein